MKPDALLRSSVANPRNIYVKSDIMLTSRDLAMRFATTIPSAASAVVEVPLDFVVVRRRPCVAQLRLQLDADRRLLPVRSCFRKRAPVCFRLLFTGGSRNFHLAKPVIGPSKCWVGHQEWCTCTIPVPSVFTLALSFLYFWRQDIC